MALPFVAGTTLHAADLNLLAPIDSPSFTTKLTVGSGVTGLVAMPWTGGGGNTFSALYNASLTASNLNYALVTSGAETDINGTVTAKIAVNNSPIITATSTGAAITGTLSSTEEISSPTLISVGALTTKGFAALTPGNSSITGYVSFTQASGVRQGYIGFSNTAAAQDLGTLKYIGGAHEFTGTLSSTGVLSVPAGTAGANAIQFGGSATTGFYSLGALDIRTPATFQGANLRATNTYLNGTGGTLINNGTPVVIASGFGTTPTITAASTAAFKITIGTGGAASGVLTFPAATNGWAVDGECQTNTASTQVVCVATSTTSVTVYAYSRTTGLASTFAAGEVIVLKSLGF